MIKSFWLKESLKWLLAILIPGVIGIILFYDSDSFSLWTLIESFVLLDLIKILVLIGFTLLLYFIFNKFLPAILVCTIGSILGFVSILWGSEVVYKQIEVANTRQQEDRFIRSVDLTGKPELGIRLGGIAGLAALASEDSKTHIRILEYLRGLLRHPPPLTGLKQQDTTSEPTMIGQRTDIEAIVRISRERTEDQRKWEEESDFQLPLNQVYLQGVVLREANLVSANLQDEVLWSAVLQRADLRGVNLVSANLQGAVLRGANLQGADLRRANLQGADLTSANLQGAVLRGANLQGAVLRGANLQGADLTSANLQGADLTSANLVFATLQRTNLRSANLQGADLRGAYLQSAILWGANLVSANLQDANLSSANLMFANLQGADLQGANLRSANLQSADLQGANLVSANLQEAILRGANLQGTNITRTNLQNAKNLTKEQLQNCFYWYDEERPDIYGPPILPEGWDPDKIGIKRRQYQQEDKPLE